VDEQTQHLAAVPAVNTHLLDDPFSMVTGNQRSTSIQISGWTGVALDVMRARKSGLAGQLIGPGASVILPSDRRVGSTERTPRQYGG
jgi:hypothetical protein